MVLLITVGLGLLAWWHYMGYPLTLWALTRVVGDIEPPAELEEYPPISIIIIAHDEAAVIQDRIRNCLDSDYPTEKMEIIVASDASTDDTVELARTVSPQVRAFNNTPHNKAQTRNRAVELASHEIILFTDADTRYEPNCVRNLVRHLSDPSVGHVCGALVSDSFEEGSIGEGMSVYWRWEYWLRGLQSRFGLLVKSSGANMGMRKEYFRAVPETADIDQVAGFDAILQAGSSRFVPEAIATEQFPASPTAEFATRKRLTVRGLTALWKYRKVMNPLRHPWLAIHTVSYWLLRYLMPVVLVGVFVATTLLALTWPLASWLVIAQLCFYLLAGVGYLADRAGRESTLTAILFSYCLANLGVAVGLVAFLTGTRIYAYDADK
jgi:cellulose synthase/poly-beta-1,6-N-acetylglucosamine synthase-like glycosyltransferase